MQREGEEKDGGGREKQDEKKENNKKCVTKEATIQKRKMEIKQEGKLRPDLFPRL